MCVGRNALRRINGCEHEFFSERAYFYGQGMKSLARPIESMARWDARPGRCKAARFYAAFFALQIQDTPKNSAGVRQATPVLTHVIYRGSDSQSKLNQMQLGDNHWTNKNDLFWSFFRNKQSIP